MHRFKPDFTASVTYFLPEHGGRQWPVHSGYQPVFQFHGQTTHVLAENVLTDREYLELGASAIAEITISHPGNLEGFLYEGQRFDIYEPPRHIGIGVIRKICNKELEKNALTGIEVLY